MCIFRYNYSTSSTTPKLLPHHSSQQVQIRPRLQAPHMSKRQSLSPKKTLIQGVEKREFGQNNNQVSLLELFGPKLFTLCCTFRIVTRLVLLLQHLLLYVMSFSMTIQIAILEIKLQFLTNLISFGIRKLSKHLNGKYL